MLTYRQYLEDKEIYSDSMGVFVWKLIARLGAIARIIERMQRYIQMCVFLLTASLVTMARIIERTQRYIRILSPPNRFCIYSGIVYTYKKNTVLDSEDGPLS